MLNHIEIPWLPSPMQTHIQTPPIAVPSMQCPQAAPMRHAGGALPKSDARTAGAFGGSTYWSVHHEVNKTPCSDPALIPSFGPMLFRTTCNPPCVYPFSFLSIFT